jgi:hypothetical protein
MPDSESGILPIGKIMTEHLSIGRKTIPAAFGVRPTLRVQAVREREILRVSGDLGGDNLQFAVESACKEVLRWAQKKAVAAFPDAAWQFQSFEQIASGRSRVAVSLEERDQTIWTIRVEDPDRETAGRIWTTEVSVIRNHKEAHFAVRQIVGSPESNLDEVEPHVPGIVRQLIKNPGLYSGIFQLTDKPAYISSESYADLLLRALLEPTRTLPIIVLTVPSSASDDNKPLIDEKILAQSCAGLAIVVVLPSRFTWKLTDRFGKRLSVFEGAIRIYQKGFTEDANPFGGHDLILPERLRGDGGISATLKQLRWSLARASVTRLVLGTDIHAFASYRLKNLDQQQRALTQTGATEAEQLETAQKRIETLEAQNREAEEFIQQFSDLHGQAEERAEAAESQLRAAGYRIQQLIDQIKERGEVPDANIILPQAWEEFADWCDTNLAGRVALSPRARRALRDTVFEDIALAARCLLWLANEFYAAKTSESDGSLRDRLIEPGITNAHCGSDSFEMEWQGKRYNVEWHIKNGGNTRDPARCLRIYYFWDDGIQQAVIAFMPEHLRTDAS